MTHEAVLRLFIHVEEPSMAETMEAWLPRLLSGRAVEAKVIDHGSKWALLNNLPARMKGYPNWPLRGLRILVLVDRDDDDCAELKRQLEAMARSAGLATKTAPAGSGAFKVVNWIVVEELEAWFLGDVPALTDAVTGVPLTLGSQARFRDPDAVTGGTWEALLRVLNKAGHYTGAPRPPKIEVARRVAPIMRFERNRSRGFQAFRAGFEALLAV